MSRQVITKTITIAGSGYNQPAKTLVAGQVVELSSAEQTAVTGAGGTIRSGSTARDALGESFGASNTS